MVCGALLNVSAQSRDQNFPTPVTTNEIEGTILARAMGDSRLTTYFYTFEGGQGDIFINLVSRNLTGDIDVYTADSLNPLTKIVLYADTSLSETGRLIYLRRPMRLILRVQGRTPNDDPATFRIKFAGSFIASSQPEYDDGPVVARSSPEEVVPPESISEKPSADRDREVVEPGKTIPAPDVKTVFGNRPSRTRTSEEGVSTREDSKAPPAARDRRPSATANPPSKSTRPADPLASIRLIIETKDGGVIEHPMSEVVRFSVDKGVLTLVIKNGPTNRYSILNVERVTIQ